MKRPSTASAGLNFLNQGYTIELSIQGLGAFLRYCERNNPGLELNVAYEKEVAIIKPIDLAVEAPSLKATLKSGLERAGFKLESKLFGSSVRPII